MPHRDMKKHLQQLHSAHGISTHTKTLPPPNYSSRNFKHSHGYACSRFNLEMLIFIMTLRRVIIWRFSSQMKG